VLLEFIKHHPAASSVAVVVAAGVLLGPDILAGTALTGDTGKELQSLFPPSASLKLVKFCVALVLSQVLLLLAVQAGLVQLPQPQLPKLPGTAEQIKATSHIALFSSCIVLLLFCRGAAAAGCASRLRAAATAATAQTSRGCRNVCFPSFVKG
jgi:hypothetical protein